ncbi:winged helix-turn-helix transcriptional regulator [Ramlibacter sp. G-1-2-2]|uniref:Winged helix-turn-helix transcriptional regulator n=1 Tax=Ramlibacter agri TaxID=2728837 RepID=A0A848H156_9BURK|nr:winged helix-turn-helix transcriptional regulator [Ramlibacter agri]
MSSVHTLPLHGDSLSQASPWDEIDEAGSGLHIDDFITTVTGLAGNALRRHVTLPYAEQFGLSVSEWRMLSVLADSRELPFSELVQRSATDKGQVSRTLRLMEERSLVTLRTEGVIPRKKVLCRITPEGLALYEQIMPIARRRQAEMIRQLSVEERRAIYGALRRLREMCGSTPAQSDDSQF